MNKAVVAYLMVLS